MTLITEPDLDSQPKLLRLRARCLHQRYQFRCFGWVVGLLIMIVVAGTMPQTASAQVIPAGLGDAFQPDLLRRDIQVLAQSLELDDAQLEILGVLHSDYINAFNAGSAGLRQLLAVTRTPDHLDEQREQLDATIRSELVGLTADLQQRLEAAATPAEKAAIAQQFKQQSEDLQKQIDSLIPEPASEAEIAADRKKVNTAIAVWDAEKARLSDELAANLHAVMTPEQRAKWPDAERDVRRSKLVPKGRLSGESVDLVALVRDLGLEPAATEAVRSILGEYEKALDTVLLARDETLRDGKSVLAEAQAVNDLRAIERQLDVHSTRHVAVRDLHRAYLDRLAPALSPEMGEALRTAYRVSAHPRVYRTTQVGRIFQAAARIAEGGPEENRQVLALRDEYLAVEAQANHDLVQVIWRHEPQQVLRAEKARFGIAVAEEDFESDPVRRRFVGRQMLGIEAVRHLKSVMVPETFNTLPGAERLTRDGQRSAGAPDASTGRSGRIAFDLDGDGQLSASEIEQARRALQGATDRN